MEIREVLQTDDFNAISRIYALSWKAGYRGIVPQEYLDELPENRWTEVLRTGPYEQFVAMEDGAYIGTSSICPARDAAMSGWGEIVSIYLLPAYFGKGVGKPLFEHSVSALRGKGYSQIYLWVLEQNTRARRFYEKAGFSRLDQSTINVGGKDLVELRYVYRAD